MKNAIVAFDRFERRGTFMHKQDGIMRLESRQDAEPILEFVKQRADMPDDRDFKYIGEIPKATLDQALIEGWADDTKAWRKWFAENPKFSAKWHRGTQS